MRNGTFEAPSERRWNGRFASQRSKIIDGKKALGKLHGRGTEERLASLHRFLSIEREVSRTAAEIDVVDAMLFDLEGAMNLIG